MEKDYINIFREDVVVPEIVQLKAEESLTRIKKEGMVGCSMKKNDVNTGSRKASKKVSIFKVCMAACACVALLGVAGHFTGSKNIAENQEGEELAQANDNDSMAETLSNMFTLKVYAAESPDASEDGYVTLEPGKSFVLVDNGEMGAVLCESEDGTISYCISVPVLCEGENIERITYGINEGAFQIVELPDSSIILDGERYEGDMNTGLIGGEESGDVILSEARLYKNFSLAYDEQANSHTWINVCDETQTMWNDVFPDGQTLEEHVNALEKLLDEVTITCTIHFADGTNDEALISIGSCIVTPEPVGNPEKDSPYAGFELRYEQ